MDSMGYLVPASELENVCLGLKYKDYPIPQLDSRRHATHFLQSQNSCQFPQAGFAKDLVGGHYDTSANQIPDISN